MGDAEGDSLSAVTPATGTASGTIRFTGTATGVSRPVVPLSAQLYGSGRRFLDVALRAYGRGDRDVFALHAGVAIEHLMKARLAAINPMLIIDVDRKPSVDAMLWLADASKHDQRPPDSLRTVSGERATELLSKRIGLGPYTDALTKRDVSSNAAASCAKHDLAVGVSLRNVAPTDM